MGAFNAENFEILEDNIKFTAERVDALEAQLAPDAASGAVRASQQAARERRLLREEIASSKGVAANQATMLNEVYDEVFVKSGQDLGDAMVRYVEPGGVFHSIRTTTSVFLASASSLRWAQSGLVRSYVFVFVVGAVVIGAIVIIASQI